MIAFREKEVNYEGKITNLFDEKERTEYRKFYPIGKVPLLELDDGHKIPESTIIAEWLDQNYSKGTRLFPEGKDECRRARLYDRFHDLYLNNSIETLRFEETKDRGIRNTEAITRADHHIRAVYTKLDKEIEGKNWLINDNFTIADISAFAGLFYANEIRPFNDYKNITAYYNRMLERTSVKDVLKEITPALQTWKKNQRNVA